MESLYLLIPVSVVLVFLIGAIFWWTLRSGQLEDLEGPAYRLLMDDDRAIDLPADKPCQQNSPKNSDGIITEVDPSQCDCLVEQGKSSPFKSAGQVQ